MKLVCGIHNIKLHHYGCVLTIGNFDSVHRGHQSLLNNLKFQSRYFAVPIIVMIFEPQPLEFFLASNAPARLTCLREKIKYFNEYGGIDYLLCIRFNHQFASLTPKAFISKVLVEKLGVRFLAIGDDFRFGKDRKGDFKTLYEAGKKYGFKVANNESLCDNGQRVSSTAIRQALLSDNLTLAEKLMGHPYRLSGRIVHGHHLGSHIGFPTANIPVKCLIMPVNGVYVVEAYGISNTSQPLPAVANIGTRPTVNGVGQQIEVHLIDVCMNIYGRHIDIILRKKLRNEHKFNTIEELIKQISQDIINARKFFSEFKLSLINKKKI